MHSPATRMPMRDQDTELGEAGGVGEKKGEETDRGR